MTKTIKNKTISLAVENRHRRRESLLSGVASAGVAAAAVLSVGSIIAVSSVQNAQGAITISDITQGGRVSENGIATSAGVSGGGGASASNNAVAFVGDGDCSIWSGDDVYGGVYGTNSDTNLGGMYGFGAETAARNYGYNSNKGANTGVITWQGAAQTFGNVTYAGSASQSANQTQAFGQNSFAVGCNSKALGLNSTALGSNNLANGTGSVAMGQRSTANAGGTIAIGISAKAMANDAIALGSLSNASVRNTVAIGSNAQATGISATALGSTANGSTDAGVLASGVGATALGGNATKGAQATGADSVAIAGQSLASGASSVAIGLSSTASGASAISVGNGSTASGAQSIAIGVGNNVSGANSGAIGDPTTITGDGSYSLGNDNTIAGANAGIFGNNGNIGTAGAGARIIGNNGSVNVADGFVLGNSASVTASGGVAIGSSSKASTAAGGIGLDPFTNKASTTTGGAWVATNGAVSVGDGSTVTRQITGLAAGTASTDAVNVAQLSKLRDYAAQGWNLTAGGENSTNVGVAGAIDLSAGSTNLLVSKGADNNNVTFDLAKDINITSVTTGNSKLTTSGLAITVGSGTTSLTGTGLSIANGPSITTTGINNAGQKATNLADATLSAASTDAVTGKQLFATNTNVSNLQRDALQWNSSLSAFDASYDSDGSGTKTAQKITNVADGELSATSKDAVNGSQLNTTNTNVSTLDTKVGTYATRTNTFLGGGADIANNKAPSYSIQGTSKTSVGDAFTAVDTAITTNKTNIATNATNIATNAGNISNLQRDALQWNSTTKAFDASYDSAGSGTKSAQKITNVAAGTSANDAVNYSQLQAVQSGSAWNVSANGDATGKTSVGGGATVDFSAGSTNLTVAKSGTNLSFDLAKDISIDSVTAGKTKVSTSGVAIAVGSGDTAGTTSLTGTGLTISGGPSITTTGIDNAGKKATNLADATLSATSTDAVTGKQLFATNANVTTVDGRVTTLDTKVGTYATRASTYLGGGADIAAGTAPSFTIQSTAYGNVGAALGAVDTTLTGLKTDALQWNATSSAYDASHGTTSAQKITNVADGTLSATSKDAVNGSQLNTTNANVTAVDGRVTTVDGRVSTLDTKVGTYATRASTYLGGGADIAAGTAPTFAIQGANYNNVNSAFGAVNSTLTTQNTNISALQTDALQWNSASLAYDASHGSGSAQKITNVANGTASSDAVNYGQLTNAINSSAWSLAVGSEAGTAIGNGATVKLLAGSSNLTIARAAGTNDITFDISKNLSLTSVTATGTVTANSLVAGNSTINNNGLTIANGPSVTATGIDAASLKVTNVAAGTLSAASKDAVNGSQLYTTNTNVASNKTAITDLQTNSLQWNGTDSFDATRNSAAQKITGVAAGTLSATSTDAVNGAQLNATNTNVSANKTAISGLQTNALQWDGTSAFDATRNNASQKITGIAAGTLSATSTDAVNGAQLNATNANVTTNKNSITALQSDALQWNANLSAYDAGHGTGTAQKITNVADGTLSTTSTDAVNGKQLNTTNTNVTAVGNRVTALDTKVATQANNVSTYLGGGADVAAGVAPTYTIQSASKTSVGDAFSAVDTALTTNKNAIATNKTAITNLQTDALQWNSASGAYDASHGSGTAQKITNVAAGTLSTTSTDAVNGAQLNATNTNVTANKTAIAASNANIANLQTNALQWNGTDSFDATRGGAAQKITGVAAGTLSATSTDAVNGAQLNTTNTNVTANKTAITANTNAIGALQTNALQWDGTGAFDATRNGGSQKITGVAAGTLSATSTDAVNGAQLNATNNNVTANKTAITSLQTDALQWNAVSGAYDASHGSGTAQKITNVADGALSTTSTDAVNGKQLNATNTNVTAVGNRVTALDTKVGTYASNVDSYLGGGASVSGGTAPSFTIQGATKNSVGDAFTSVDTALTTNRNAINANKTAITGLQTDALQWNATSGAYDASHGTTSAQKITNVAAGTLSTTSTDAVNGAQLNATNANVTAVGNRVTDVDTRLGTAVTNANKYFGGSTDLAAGTAPSFTIQGNATNNVTSAFGAVDTALTGHGTSIAALQTNALQWNQNLGAYDASHGSNAPQKISNVANGTNTNDAVNLGQLNEQIGQTGWNLSVNNANSTKIGKDATVDLKSGSSNLTIAKATGSNDVTFDIARNLDLDSIQAGNVKLDNTGLVITGGASVTTTGVNAGNQKITNVAQGTAATDAVNFGQLTTTNNNVAANTTAIAANKTAITANTTDITGLKTNALQWNGTDSFDATRNGAAQKITGVAAGTSASDAVNFGQLTTTNTNLTNVANRLTTAVSNTDKYFGGTTDVAGGVAPSFATQNGTANNVTDAFSAVNTSITGQATSIAALQTDALQWSSSLGAYDASHGSNAPQRISNVAAGTSATDAANVGQLTTAISSTGWNLSANGSNASKVGNGGTVDLRAGSSNLTIAKATDSSTVAFDIAKDLDLTSVKTGDATLNTNGLTITGGPSVTKTGIDAGNTKVTNVAAGTAASDAVNFGQLTTTNTNVAANTTAISANKTAIATNTTDIAGLKTNALQWNGADAFNATRDGVSQKITGVAAGTLSTTSTDAVNGAQLNATNTNVTANKAAIATNTTDIAGLKTNALQWNGTDAFNATRDGVSQKITGVAAGTLSTTSSDAVNGAQLNATNTNVAANKTAIAANTTNIAGLQTNALQWNGTDSFNATRDGVSQKITGLADGDVSATSTDAVNGKQLNTTNTNVTNVANRVTAVDTRLGTAVSNTNKYLGGGADVAAGTAPSFSVQGATKNTVADAFGAVDSTLTAHNTAINNNTTSITALQTDALQWNSSLGAYDASHGTGTAQKITNVATGTNNTDAVNVAQLNDKIGSTGWNLTANGANSSKIGNGGTVDLRAGSSNLTVTKTADSNAVAFDVAQDLNLTSVKTGSTTLNNNGLTIANGPSVTSTGIDAGNTKVTNVAAGTAASDAVNFGQLTTTNTNVAANTTAISANKTAIATNTTDIAGLKTNALQWNGTDAFNATRDGVSQKITGVAAGTLSTTSTDAVNGAQLNATNTNVTANKAAIATNTTNIAGLQTNALQWNGTDAFNATRDGVSQKITGVAAGTLSTTSTDAVNGAQLNATNTNVTANKAAIATNTANIAGLQTNALQWNGTDAFDATRGGAAQKITGVAAGTLSATSTDAVNGAQLNATNTNVTNVQNRVADVDTRLGTAVSNTNKYFGGTTDVAAGVAPSFKVQGTTYSDATSAFGGVDTSLNSIKNDVASISTDALKWDATTNAFNAQRTDAAGNTSKGKITNVGDATLSATSSDAVTGSQLFATNKEVTANQARIANVADKTSLYLGGGADLASDTAPTYNIGSNTFNNVGSALTAVDSTLTGHGTSIATLQRDAMQWNDGLNAFSASRNGAAQRITNVANGTEATDAVNKSQLDTAISNSGWNLTTDGQNSTKVGAGDSVDLKSGSNINVSKSANGRDVTFDLAKDITVDSVTATDVAATNVTADSIKAGNTSIDTNGLTIANGPSVTASGINAASKKVTNVADATLSATSKDAVNGSQLFATNSNIDQVAANTSSYLGGGADVKTGQAPSYSVQGGTYDNVGSALGGVDAAFNNVNSQISTINNSALMWSVGEGAYDAARDKGTGTKTNSKITHLQDGTLSADSSDAVTGSQLWKTQQDVNDTSLRLTNIATNTSNYLGGGANVQTGEAPTYKVQGDTYRNVGDAFNGVDTSLTNVQNQIANVNKDALMWDSSLSAYNAARPDATGASVARRITGVAEGNVNASSTDAVNGSQLNATNLNVESVTDRVNTVAQNTNKYLGGGADVANGVAPSFNVQGTKYNNVSAAFGGVNANLTDIKDQVASINTDALKWDSDLSAFSAAHDDGTGTKVASKITNVKSGRVAADSTDAVNGSQLFTTNTNIAAVRTTVNDHAERVATYLGGGADIIGGTAPTYNVQGQAYRDVGSAFGGVNSNLTDIKGQIAGINNDALMWDATLGAFSAAHDNGTGTKVASKITNVAAGEVSATSTDAINGSQLFTTNTRVTTIANTTSAALGGGADLANGKAPSYQISTISSGVSFRSGSVDGVTAYDADGLVSNFDNVGDALTQLNTNVNTVNTKVENVKATVTDLSKNALVWDETANAFSANHTKDGVTTKSKITNIADGSLTEGSSDAVTGGQLYSSNSQIASFFGGGAAFTNGTWTAPTFVVSQIGANGTQTNGTYNNVNDAFGGVNSSVNNVNQRVTDVQNQINNLGPDANALRYDETAGGYNAGAKNNQPNKIVNVANGTVAQNSKDAVNGGQLWDTNQRIDSIQTSVTDVATNSVMYDKDSSGNKTNSISLKGADASKPVTINNVADGKIEKGSKQAVNGGQLYDYTKEQAQVTLNESKAYTDQKVDNIVQNSVEQSNYYTDTKFNQLNSSITNARKEARRGAAIGLAAASLRYDDTPGKFSVATGGGFWKSEGALAFGAGYTSETGKVRSNITATTAGGDWGVGAGVSITLN
ncbi:YadA-like family protein [Bartonella sp. HY329]|uniref:YadA-like family protein n=1 Tax=unclassified Bartonella TaxID=2645622 RepID=UPI0021C8A513|nr:MULTISPECIES: YadA-like family protein [unclassified Bartonella]UXM94717.1 YadA-like family protein [Bartonella sp. HY329]UXN09040.1 YadA-like family protein [Bartonella sp. HY328]